jgi:hypothetical protein
VPPPPQWEPQWGTSPYAPPQSQGNGFSITAIVLGAIAFLFVPPLFGIVGLIFGGVGLSKKEKLAPVGMIVAGVGLIGGMILGAVVFSALHRG